MDNNVNHPAHYNSMNYECIDVMRDVFGDDAVKTWIKLNIFKYSWRADHKNGDEDVAKIAWYASYYDKMNKQTPQPQKITIPANDPAFDVKVSKKDEYEYSTATNYDENMQEYTTATKISRAQQDTDNFLKPQVVMT